MKLTYENSTQTYVFVGNYDDRLTPKGAGFRWNARDTRWETKSTPTARKLSYLADESAIFALKIARENVAASKRAESSNDFSVPAPVGCAYLGYQRAGIEYASQRDITLIADEMGLGKTIQAIGLINYLNLKNILIICPASLKLNWERECKKWLVNQHTIEIVNGKSLWNCEVEIINYEIVKKYRDKIDARTWDLMICDEAHYLKNHKAQRTRIILGGTEKSTDEDGLETKKKIEKINAKRTLFLTGTPVLNRPIELFTVLNYADIYHSWYGYVKKFCAGEQTRYGWNIKGASNTEELQDLLREKIMIRRKKSEVLGELPEKIRQIITLDAPKSAEITQEIAKTKRLNEIKSEIAKLREEKSENYTKKIAALSKIFRADFAEISVLRHKNALRKIDDIVSAATDTVEQNGCAVIFTHHADVAEEISKKLNENNIKSACYTGQTTIENRQKIVDDFQNEKIDVFVGTIGAAGVGITLTRASTAIFCELEWTPAVLAQAEDRLHRIGQRNCVQSIYYVYAGTIDEMLANALLDKELIISEILEINEEKIS